MFLFHWVIWFCVSVKTHIRHYSMSTLVWVGLTLNTLRLVNPRIPISIPATFNMIRIIGTLNVHGVRVQGTQVCTGSNRNISSPAHTSQCQDFSPYLYLCTYKPLKGSRSFAYCISFLTLQRVCNFAFPRHQATLLLDPAWSIARGRRCRQDKEKDVSVIINAVMLVLVLLLDNVAQIFVRHVAVKLKLLIPFQL